MSRRLRSRRLLGMRTYLFSLAAAGAAILPLAALITPSTSPVTLAMQQAPTITPFLWFEGDAEAAIGFYTSIFPDAKLVTKTWWGEGGPVPKGTLMTATFRLAGREFMAINGGPMHRFNEAISLFVSCADQAEVDHYWAKLTADGGEENQCGWLKDKYGLSWQVVPSVALPLLADPDPARARRVAAAFLQMRKIDVAALERAHQGK